jgi:hypothetical protein
MTTEQLAALKEVAEKAKEEQVDDCPDCQDIAKKFRNLFTPTTCLALLEEVERLREGESNVSKST